MSTSICTPAAVEALGPVARLFEYPDENFATHYAAAVEGVRAAGDEGAVLLDEFYAEMARLSVEQAQELYTRTFDLAPVCVPYASVHLFGGESFKRAELMSGLNAAYARCGLERDGELPDHLAVLLRAVPMLDDEEREELARFVVSPALEKMAKLLESANSPWRHAVQVARRLLAGGDASND